jgi:hypothetical protein
MAQSSPSQRAVRDNQQHVVQGAILSINAMTNAMPNSEKPVTFEYALKVRYCLSLSR